MRRLGVGRGALVVLAHGNSASFFADLFAVWSVGATSVCVNPTLTAPELANIVDFMAPAAVLVAPGTVAGDGVSVPVLCLDDEATESADQAPDRGAELDDPALVLFTSGTTGTPKGVVHSFRAILARTALNQAFIGRQALRRTLCLLPTHFGHSLIGNSLTPLLAGADLLLYPDSGLQGTRAIGSLLAEQEVTFMSSVPAFWRMALTFGRPPARASLAQVSIGSAPLSGTLWREVVSWTGTDHVVNMYGITEAANWVAAASARKHDPADGLIGRPWGGAAAVLTPDGAIATEGDGELLLQTPSLMTGYHARPDLTREVLRAGWYHTGDAGRIDADGRLHLAGRRGHEINRAGVKVHPEEIDLLLERHPQVVEACTFAIPDAVSGEIVGIAVKILDDAGVDETALRAWCGERIKRESLPERWFLVDAIPKTERGKLDRDAVRELCLGAAPS